MDRYLPEKVPLSGDPGSTFSIRTAGRGRKLPCWQSELTHKLGGYPVCGHVRGVARPHQAGCCSSQQRHLSVGDVGLHATRQADAGDELANLSRRTLVYLNHGARLLEQSSERGAPRPATP
jgi:hypothetical protein